MCCRLKWRGGAHTQNQTVISRSNPVAEEKTTHSIYPLSLLLAVWDSLICDPSKPTHFFLKWRTRKKTMQNTVWNLITKNCRDKGTIDPFYRLLIWNIANNTVQSTEKQNNNKSRRREREREKETIYSGMATLRILIMSNWHWKLSFCNFHCFSSHIPAEIQFILFLPPLLSQHNSF